jgi:hypothetical protein
VILERVDSSNVLGVFRSCHTSIIQRVSIYYKEAGAFSSAS